MTGRYLARDIRDAIVTKLTSELSSMITTINSERSDTTPAPSFVNYLWDMQQVCAVFVDIGDSETILEEILNDNYTILPELFQLDVSTRLIENSDNIYNYVENYIEAFIRILHSYSDGNITWIRLLSTERNDIYENKNTVSLEAKAIFEVRIN